MTASEIAARSELAQSLAREAGALARRYFLCELDYTAEEKGPQDWVSAADRAVEVLIRERIAREFPGDTMVGEEGGGEHGARLWLVDPIDGTMNFVRGVRYWCVSIGFVAHGQRTIGVIYDPSLDELFAATRGQGAFDNGVAIRVSPRDRIDYALLCAGYVPRHSLDQHLALKRRLHEAGAVVKDMGAGALMLAHVAAGRYDAFVEPHMHPWDAAAGLLLVEEAGGCVARYPGPGGWAAGGEVIASSPGIFAELQRLVGAR